MTVESHKVAVTDSVRNLNPLEMLVGYLVKIAISDVTVSKPGNNAAGKNVVDTLSCMVPLGILRSGA